MLFLRGRSAHHFVRFIHCRKQVDVGGCISIGKPVSTVVPLADRSPLSVAADQSRYLRPRLNPVILPM